MIDWLFPRPVLSFRHRLVVMACRLCVVGQVMVSISCVCRADRGRGEIQGHGFHHIKHLTLHLAILTFLFRSKVKMVVGNFLSNNSEKIQCM